MTRLFETFSALALTILVAQAASAQQVRTVTINKEGEAVVVETAVEAAEVKPAEAEKKDKPPGESTPEGEKGKEGDKKKDNDKKPEGGPVQRPRMSPDVKAKPITEEVTLNDEGVMFNMKGQSWESVLQWLADESKLTLDWQELPGDTLNLTTTRSYSLEEARDILNRHLLSRGYTMLLEGELLSVHKLSDVKSSLVPRLQPEDLESQFDHSLVKVSFDLDWLIADEAVEELAPLLSKAGKISKMSRTNRLEIMDTAGTLKDIYQILLMEQSESGQEQLVKTFRLEHRRANEVMTLLMDLLGMDRPPGSGAGGGGGNNMGEVTNVMRQMTQQLQKMASNSGGGGGGKGGSREPTKTRLVLNQRENMILAQAMPDQMAIIEKAIAQIDVPTDARHSLLQNMNKFRVYPLQTVDPQSLVDLLTELGDMAPGTVLNVNKDKKSIVAFATLADHLTITTLVEKLDQSGRVVEVIPLRRLEADYVAGTIRALMAPEAKDDNSSRYSYYSRYSSSEPKQEEKDFKVEADIENNRLLVYANTVEMEEIMELLQKLGELPNPNGIDDGIRVFEMSPAENPHDVLERLKQLWRGDNELQIDIPEPPVDAEEPASEESDVPDKAKAAPVSVTSVPQDTSTGRMTAAEFFAMLHKESLERQQAQTTKPATMNWQPKTKHQSGDLQLPAAAVVETDNARQPILTFAEDDGKTFRRPPVRFSLSPDGQLIVTSDDKEALQEVEDLLKKLVQPAPNYKVFHMKHATPSWVTINLEEYFRAEEETETSMSYDYFYGYRPSTKKKSGSPSLGRRRQPTFIYDNLTSTILVRDADRKQLRVIEDLIAIYDVAEPADSRSMRVTRIFKLKNSQAETVAQAVKDVFRDLLSANDKALEKKGEEKQQARVYSYFGGGDDDEGDEAPIRFKGLLSIGMDTTSDTLVVSSKASLMESVSELILELDEAAEQTSILHVVKVDPTVDITLIQERLSKALGVTTSKNDQNKKDKNGQPQQQQGENGKRGE
jgi:type II secretory pathway component GspD/PulD (secretin)